MAQDYPEWAALLRGEKVNILQAKPFGGFFRTREGKPVAIWQGASGTMRCKVGTEDWTDRIDKVWPYCAERPVSYADYSAALKTGQWPDTPKPAEKPAEKAPEKAPEKTQLKDLAADKPAGKADEAKAKPAASDRKPPPDAPSAREQIGGNNPPDEMKLVRENADEDVKLARHRVSLGACTSADDQKEVEQIIARLKAAEEKVGDHRDSLVRPLNEEVKRINAVWIPIERTIKIAREDLQVRVIRPWLDAERARERAAREEEAKRLAAEAKAKEEAAKREGSATGAAEAEAAKKAAAAASRQVEAKTAVKSTVRVAAKRWRAKIEDYPAFALYLLQQGHADLKEHLERIANSLAATMKTQSPAPGVTASEED